MTVSTGNKPRIAIVGSGISSLTCGYLLSQQYEVTLFEAADYLAVIQPLWMLSLAANPTP